MTLPLSQVLRIGSHAIKNQIKGGKYPLVLMLEPLLRCNLACKGCGKIDYPDAILNRRLSYAECMSAIDECGAPAVSIAGGEPLLSFAAITDDPPPEVATTGHDRMIVNLKPEHIAAWLTPAGRSLEELQGILSDRQAPFYEHEVLAA